MPSFMPISSKTKNFNIFVDNNYNNRISTLIELCLRTLIKNIYIFVQKNNIYKNILTQILAFRSSSNKKLNLISLNMNIYIIYKEMYNINEEN